MAKKFFYCFCILLLINSFAKAQPDLTPPAIQSVTAVSSTKVDILFDEPLDNNSANIFSNYLANNGLGMPVSARTDAENPSLVHLTFENVFINGYAYTLLINDVKDLAGNAIKNATSSFNFFVPHQYDIVIDELMSDPSPGVGLPDFEWIELKNTSSFPINLNGWRISDLTSTSGPLSEIVLQPDSFLIVCTSSALSALTSFGKAISITKFPSLDNGGDLISVADANGNIIHAVQYTDDWYQNELKKDGGWSLEMIDTKNPCGGFSNWIASKDQSGGTPGRKNSQEAVNKDEQAPGLLNAFATNSTTVTLVFNEPLDSLKAASAAAYSFDNGLTPINRYCSSL